MTIQKIFLSINNKKKKFLSLRERERVKLKHTFILGRLTAELPKLVFYCRVNNSILFLKNYPHDIL